MICSEPQTPAAMLISPNSESFDSKLHATTPKDFGCRLAADGEFSSSLLQARRGTTYAGLRNAAECLPGAIAPQGDASSMATGYRPPLEKLPSNPVCFCAVTHGRRV